MPHLLQYLGMERHIEAIVDVLLNKISGFLCVAQLIALQRGKKNAVPVAPPGVFFDDPQEPPRFVGLRLLQRKDLVSGIGRRNGIPAGYGPVDLLELVKALAGFRDLSRVHVKRAKIEPERGVTGKVALKPLAHSDGFQNIFFRDEVIKTVEVIFGQPVFVRQVVLGQQGPHGADQAGFQFVESPDPGLVQFPFAGHALGHVLLFLTARLHAHPLIGLQCPRQLKPCSRREQAEDTAPFCRIGGNFSCHMRCGLDFQEGAIDLHFILTAQQLPVFFLQPVFRVGSHHIREKIHQLQVRGDIAPRDVVDDIVVFLIHRHLGGAPLDPVDRNDGAVQSVKRIEGVFPVLAFRKAGAGNEQAENAKKTYDPFHGSSHFVVTTLAGSRTMWRSSMSFTMPEISSFDPMEAFRSASTSCWVLGMTWEKVPNISRLDCPWMR